ncbi:MAG: bifunctional cytidylyltransferase/SDR family oxidoreductase [Chlamydiales bacterium]|jgi:2-C-methyl-D-erythritol 4-phosphate cytidylyltransferase|nr:bifunctional cytidylyltransferase/SDR family oxidoreductase [Chlamydiales bacterium]
MIVAILLMAGSGSRFGSQIPKQFHRLSGEKIYQHTLDKFLKTQLFSRIILVCAPEYIEQIQKETSFKDQVYVVAGGSNRQASSLKGLLACPPHTEIVVIHDAVRPFVNKEILQKNISLARLHKAVDTCIASSDTLIHTIDLKQIHAIPPRSQYLRGQTPQSFSYALILEAHLNAIQKNSSDDCSLVLAKGHRIFITEGSEYNIKITTELDLFLAEQIFRLQHSGIEFSLKTLKNKRYIITGGSGEIGQAIRESLEKEGAEAIDISRSSKSYPANLCYHSDVEKAFVDIFNKFGLVDGLINSVGFLIKKPFIRLSEQEIQEIVAANLTSVLFCCKCAQIKPQGHILNIASSCYSRGRKNYAVYASCKAAIVNFTQGLAEEYSHLYINAIAPQRTATAMRHREFPNEDPSTLLSTAEVAETILNCLKSSITGSLIEVRSKPHHKSL